MSPDDRPECAIFDVEGTLVDCVPLILESWRATLQEAGHSFTHLDLQPYSGMDGSWMLEQLLPKEPAATREALLKAQGERYRAHFIERAQAFPAVRALFETLKHLGVRIGIATTCKADELAIYESRLGVLDMADAISCGDVVKHGKPDPALLIHCHRSLDLENPSRAVVIGDTPFDALAAKGAQMRAVGVLTGGFAAASLMDAGCEDIFDQVEQTRRLWHSNGAFAATTSAPD
jgi:HAD superfamily hydrolase (TIGR01549 family)